MAENDSSEQTITAWQSDELAGFRIGDLVRLPSVSGALEVQGFKPPSLLILRAPSGVTVQAGWRIVQRVRIKRRINRDRGGND